MNTYNVEADTNGRQRSVTVSAQSEREAIHIAMEMMGVPFSSIEAVTREEDDGLH